MNLRWLDQEKTAVVYALPGRVVVDRGALFRDARAGRIAVRQPGPVEVNRAGVSMSARQLVFGLVNDGWITEAEGRTWLERSGLPAAAVALIDALPEGERFAAEAKALGMREAVLTDPLLVALAEARGVTPEILDQFFDKYARV